MVDNDTISSISSQLTINGYINLVSYTILYYDYALTLPAEVERFWATRSLSWPSTFFYLNRYLTLFGHIPFIYQNFWTSRDPNRAHICASLSTYHQYLAVITQIVVGVLLVMRVYALYDRSRRVLLFVVICGFAVIAFGAWSVAAGRGTKPTVFQYGIACTPPLDKYDATRLANAWIGMLLFDVLIFVMTVIKSWRRGYMGGRSFFKVLLRDGAIYFGIMAVVGLMNILTFHVAPEYQRGIVTTFANVSSSTMMSRLMLNLRDPELSARMPTRSTEPVLSTVLEFYGAATSTAATTTTRQESRGHFG